MTSSESLVYIFWKCVNTVNSSSEYASRTRDHDAVTPINSDSDRILLCSSALSVLTHVARFDIYTTVKIAGPGLLCCDV